MIKDKAYHLGKAYYLGKGVCKNLKTAYKYFLYDTSEYALYYRSLVLYDRSFSGFDLQLASQHLSKALEMRVYDAKAHVDRISHVLNSGSERSHELQKL